LDPYVALRTAYYQRRTGDRISVDAEDETGGEESPASPFFVP
jgi:ABC-type transporter lipoprotein component MlaA